MNPGEEHHIEPLSPDAERVLLLLFSRYRTPFHGSTARGIAQALKWWRVSGDFATNQDSQISDVHERRVRLALRELEAVGLVAFRASAKAIRWNVTELAVAGGDL